MLLRNPQLNFAPLFQDFMHKFYARENEESTSSETYGNMDQTPLPLELDDKKTYEKRDAEEVWSATGQSGLEKRQCTVQLTIFADGSTLPPLIISRGKGLRIKAVENQQWNKRVKIVFQSKAWCGEAVMKSWVKEDWGNIFLNPATPGSTGKILFADVHAAQQTDDVKILLGKLKTTLINVPSGKTSRVQPLDVVINKPFKSHVRYCFERHLNENFDLYVEGKLLASERRVVTTKWVAESWEKIKHDKEMIRHSFLKCGLSNALDGREDHEVNIKGIDGYTMPEPESEFHMVSCSESEDEEADFETESSDSESSTTSNIVTLVVPGHFFKRINLKLTSIFVLV